MQNHCHPQNSLTTSIIFNQSQKQYLVEVVLPQTVANDVSEYRISSRVLSNSG
ncbi:hypothetical protein [Acinetobacter bereziniae]|uniref:hypothetical protein n=1 Tax=Acinetobacter bereziniae TaxID=106648 RepID=UPI00148F29C2|nr:hypothetical protein [Acinetobacter bereziniae]MBJ9902429.1 hypothetical protein [Acinetobacter bereziniae]MCU4318839.1 hypothetical protein [Acinetobacter bereziniae]MCU4416589.1 hypothetical protein [Acinetobacter bereziniae]MCU4599594.1 hypothetical protein [Acinetobacter bereziniae]